MRRFYFFLLFLILSASGFSQPATELDTTIKGGRMELIDKGETVMFKDGVSLERGGDILKAREMTTNKNREKVSAVGDVQLFRRMSSTETLQAFGERGSYDTTTGKGSIESKRGQAHLIHTSILSTTSVRIVNLFANKVDFSNKEQAAIAQGSVKGDTIDPETRDFYKFWSEKAEWDGNQRRIVLTGTPMPVVRQENAEETKVITGNRVTYFIDQRKFMTEGNAKAVITDKKGRKPAL